MARAKGFMTAIFVLAFAAGLAACGGGGGTAATGGGTVTLQGIVPGTVFVAVDNATNTEVARATASGTPKTFSMTISTGKSYRFYLMENESAGSGARVYPYYVGSTNVFEMDNTAGPTIDLGTIAPDLATGNAASTNNPMLGPGVMGRGANGMMPASLAGAMFSMDNLAGAWHFNMLTASGTMGWTHGTLAVDNAGMGAMTGIVRNGVAMPAVGDIPYTMTPGGMVFSAQDNTFHAVMSKDMSLMVATFTDNTGGFSLMMSQKRGGVFSTTDLDGTWRFQRMTAGTDNLVSGWAYGQMTIAGGSATVTAITSSNGSPAPSFTFSMGADGVMTAVGDASFDGAMSKDKSMIVATANNAVSGSDLWILMKSGGSFTMSDMAGDWMVNGLIAGNAGSRDWTTGHSVIGTGGQMTFSQMMGHGAMLSMAPSTLVMDAAGGITMSGMAGMGGGMMGSTVTQTYHGTMNASKGMLLSTFSDGTGGHRMSIQLK